MDDVNLSKQHNMEKTKNGDVKNIYKIPDNYSTLQSMSEIKKCVEKISSLQKVLKDSSCNSRSSFDQVDKSIAALPKYDLTAELSKYDKKVQVKDGNYFLEVLKSEQNRLIAKADEIEPFITAFSENESINEQVLGILRSASGKSRLLVSQKMKQFEGLCHKNLTQNPDEKFQTTNEDLQGFWDMVTLQVNDVDSLFEKIEKLKNDNWILQEESDFERNPVSKLILKKANTSKSQSNSNQTASKKIVKSSVTNGDARRKELMELKRKAKNAMQTKETDNSNDSKKLEFFF